MNERKEEKGSRVSGETERRRNTEKRNKRRDDSYKLCEGKMQKKMAKGGRGKERRKRRKRKTDKIKG